MESEDTEDDADAERAWAMWAVEYGAVWMEHVVDAAHFELM